MESDFGPQPFIFCNNLADRKQRVAKSKEQEQGSGDEQTPDAGEPDFEAVEPTKAADGLIEFSGNSVESARNIADAQVAQAKAELDELAKKAPMKGKIKLSGSPIAMIKQQKQADEIYKQQKAEHDQQLEAAQKRYAHWQSIQNDIKTRQESTRHEQALAEDAERKRKKAELKAEQERGVEVVTGKQLENEILENKGKEAETSQDVSVYSLTADEAQDFISNMELSADEAPEIDLTIENWDALFGEGGIVNTPIGDVKMGENQFAKMMRQGRDGKLGMIKPTLESPYVIIEDASKAKDGDTTERASSYIFIRSFKKADGSRYYYFTSVTVSKDGKEVVVSSQEKSRKRILRLLQEGNVIWRTPKDATTISAKRQGLDYEQTDKAETATKGSGITPQSTPSESKGTEKAAENKALDKKLTACEKKVELQVEYDKLGKDAAKAYEEFETDKAERLEKEQDVIKKKLKRISERFEDDDDYNESYTEFDRLNEEKKKISEELGKAIGDNDRDAESRLWKEDRAIDEKKREVVSKLSDEELSEIRHYDEANDELKRREAKKADDEFIEKSAEAQGDDVRVKPKNKKTTIHSFSAGKKGQVRPQLYGVYHSPDGAAVSTDAYVLVVSKSAYDKSKKGKIVDKDGKEIIGKYPDYRKVLPKENSPVKVDYDDMLSFVSGAIERYEAADKGNKRYPENVQVVLRLPDGRRVVINAYTLEKFIRGAKMTGADNIDTDVEPLRPITARSKDGEVCSMPVNLRREDGKPGEDVFVYDVKGGENNGIKEHRGEEATAVSEEDAAMRDVLVDKMKESGIDVVTDSEGGQKILDMANDVRLSKDKKRALETVSVTSDEAHQPTVVSSADGAKVLKNLDNLATKYEEKTSRSNTLLGDVAEAIGAEKHGSNSQYATFECKNGNVVTIRLANHNAAVSTFDNHGESEGISIVVSPKKNAGVKKDGNAHVTEFFYDAILLRRAEGKPLAEIIRSIQQALYSGKFEDKTGLAQREEVNGDDIIRYHKVYHGSGADFDEFDHSHIGEGEGAQAFGWGTYLTEVKGIGEGYARKMGTSHKGRILKMALDSAIDIERQWKNILANKKKELSKSKKKAEDKRQEYESLKAQAEQIRSEYGETSKEYRRFSGRFSGLNLAESLWRGEEESVKRKESYIDIYKQRLEESKQAVREAQAAYDKETEGHKSILYTVEVPDDNGKNFLHWESQTPSETVEKIRDYVREHCSEEVAEEFDKQIAYGTDNPDLAEYGQNGENVYKAVEYALGSDKKASLVLSELGMQGISYPADFMRGGRKDGARNYVIFKEEDAKITDKVRFFRTKNGKAYGFTVGGKIYVDPRIAKADTPIHEYSHLWASMFRDVNPKEWSNVVKLMKDTPLWEEIRKKYPELKTDEEIADEVLAHFSGKRGAERLRQAQQEAMKEKGVSAKASAISAIERVRKALSTFWKGVCDLLHIHFTSAEEVADRVLSDMLNGVDPVKVKNEAKNTWYEESKFKTLRGEDAENELQTILSSKEAPKMPVAISDLANFKEVFKNPVRTVLGKLIKVKDAVYNKMLRNNRTSISGAVMPTLTNADFIIQEIDGSTLYFKRFQNEKSEDVYNIAVVNKNDEIEDYISSVHIKSNNNIINKIKNGAELLIPDNRNGYGENSPSNSTPSGANLGRNTESGKNSEGNLHYRDENGVETKATSATDPKSKTSRATEISEHLNTPVRVITSEKEMEGLSPRQKKAKGWYNTATGEVVVVVPNNADVADVENTVLHEVIGHDGIRDFRL